MTSHPLVHNLRMQTFGVPPRYRTALVSTLAPNEDQVQAYEAACAFVDNLRDRYVTTRRPVEEFPRDETKIGRGLIFQGPPGTGKTTLAAATLLSVYYTHVLPVRFVSMPDYVSDSIEAIRLEKADDDDSRERRFEVMDRLQDARDVPVLLLDDVGKEHRAQGSDYSRNLFDQLIRERHRNGRPTIITTNMPVKDWGSFYNETMASLVTEAFDVLTIAGKDQRRGKR